MTTIKEKTKASTIAQVPMGTAEKKKKSKSKDPEDPEKKPKTTPVLPASSSTTPIAFIATDSSVELAQHMHPASIEVLSHWTLQCGDTFKATVDGIQFFARVPQGGVQQGETFINVYPSFVKVRAPKCYNAGVTFEATHEDVRFLATVPVGGCQQGDMIETLHPSVAPPPRKRGGINWKVTGLIITGSITGSIIGLIIGWLVLEDSIRI